MPSAPNTRSCPLFSFFSPHGRLICPRRSDAKARLARSTHVCPSRPPPAIEPKPLLAWLPRAPPHRSLRRDPQVQILLKTLCLASISTLILLLAQASQAGASACCAAFLPSLLRSLGAQSAGWRAGDVAERAPLLYRKKEQVQSATTVEGRATFKHPSTIPPLFFSWTPTRVLEHGETHT